MTDWSKVPQDFYTNLGPSGVKISKVIVGCMSFGDKKWLDWVVEDKEKVFAIMKRAYDEGIRTYDTADAYSNGVSEILLREFMEKYKIKRDKIVILSKVFFQVEEDNVAFSRMNDCNIPAHEFINSHGLSRKHIFDAVKASVERLGTYMDVLQIHRFDANTPIEETMEALNDVIKEGHTRYIGASSMKTYQFVMMQSFAEKHGWAKFISMQNYYNLLHREEEAEMIAYCKTTGVGVIPYSSNAGGLLCRPNGAHGETTRCESDKPLRQYYGLYPLTESDEEIIKRVEEVSKKHGVSMASISTAYVLFKGANPICGFSKPERIGDAVAGIKLKLSKEDVEYLEEPYEPKKPVSFG